MEKKFVVFIKKKNESAFWIFLKLFFICRECFVVIFELWKTLHGLKWQFFLWNVLEIFLLRKATETRSETIWKGKKINFMSYFIIIFYFLDSKKCQCLFLDIHENCGRIGRLNIYLLQVWSSANLVRFW